MTIHRTLLLGLLCAGVAQPLLADDSAGTWLVKVGINRITPHVKSGDLSAPSYPGTQIDVGSSARPILTVGYNFTDNVTAEFFAGLPYKHDITGEGAIQGVGTIATVKQISPTLMGQYHFFDPGTLFRPYVGIGATYVRNYGEQGTNVLTALTNPGGSATTLHIDNGWGTSLQAGLAVKVHGNWFLDAGVIKTYFKTTAHLSTGQHIDADLDPIALNLSAGYHF